MQYSKLDIFDSPFVNPNTLTEEEQKQAILLIRTSIFERAFLMYQREAAQAKVD